jgi:hypothetical protein
MPKTVMHVSLLDAKEVRLTCALCNGSVEIEFTDFDNLQRKGKLEPTKCPFCGEDWATSERPPVTIADNPVSILHKFFLSKREPGINVDIQLVIPAPTPTESPK